LSNPKLLPCDELAIRAGSSVAACASRKWWVLTAAVLGSTLAYVDESIINVALPQIESALRTTLSAMQWVVNAYTLSLCALLLAGGAAADQFGRRRIFIIGVTIFAIASLGCGFAPNAALLVCARILQGIGAALLVPCSLALISASFDEKTRGSAIGIWAGASAIAAGAAPLLGGWLIDHVSWRVIFLINPLLAIPTLWITITRVPESRDPDAPPAIDWWGAVLAFLGLGCVAYALIGSSSSLGWEETSAPLFGIGVLLLVGFVLVEKRSRYPMMPLTLFHSRTFSGLNLLTLLLYGALGGAFFFLPFLLIQTRGYSATAAGAAYLPFTLVLGLLSHWSGGLLSRFGARAPLTIGPMLVALGFLALSFSGYPYYTVLLSMTLLGFGMAVTVAPLTTAVLNAVPPNRTGVASGINNAVASVGSLLLIAAVGTLALGIFDRSLDESLKAIGAAPPIVRAVDAARGGFVLPTMPQDLPEEARNAARSLIVDSLSHTIRLVLWLAAALALLAGLVAALTVRDGQPREGPGDNAPSAKPAGEPA
jgi:EmrB/QacA subfamily drug resistance transporter